MPRTYEWVSLVTLQQLRAVVAVARVDLFSEAARVLRMSQPTMSRGVSTAVKETAMPERKSHGRSTTGDELTDEVLDRMAHEAEEGLDVTKLRRRPGRPAMGSAPAESFAPSG